MIPHVLIGTAKGAFLPGVKTAIRHVRANQQNCLQGVAVNWLSTTIKTIGRLLVIHLFEIQERDGSSESPRVTFRSHRIDIFDIFDRCLNQFSIPMEGQPLQLTDHQVHMFHSRGYLILKEVIPMDIIRQLKRECVDLLDNRYYNNSQISCSTITENQVRDVIDKYRNKIIKRGCILEPMSSSSVSIGARTSRKEYLEARYARDSTGSSIMCTQILYPAIRQLLGDQLYLV